MSEWKPVSRILFAQFGAVAAVGMLLRSMNEDRAAWITFGCAAFLAVWAFIAQLIRERKPK